MYRDEGVACATSLWAAEVQAELQLWPGGFHTFDTFALDISLTARLLDARKAWMERLLVTTSREGCRATRIDRTGFVLDQKSTLYQQIPDA